MEFVVERKLECKRYVYTIPDDFRYRAECNLGLNLRTIQATDETNNTTYSLRQKNWLLKVLSWILTFVFPSRLFPAYVFSRNGEQWGTTKAMFFSGTKQIHIGEDVYALSLHSHNYVSVMKNDVQIALIQKSELTVAEQNTYRITHDAEDVLLLLLFVAFADMIFYPNRHRVDSVRYEKTIGPDPLQDRTAWKPKQS